MTPLPDLVYPPGGPVEPGPAPVILFLHGSGERGTDRAGLKVWGPLRYLDEGHTLSAFVAAPQCPPDLRWGDLLDELDDWLDGLLGQYPLDADRIYLTGFSMGGFGAWQWALRRPERFAALMPVGGNGFTFREHEVAESLVALKDMPIWMIHGAQDEVVPISGADDFYRALLECGTDFGYTRYPHAGHTETSSLAYWDTVHYDWLLGQKRQGNR